MYVHQLVCQECLYEMHGATIKTFLCSTFNQYVTNCNSVREFKKTARHVADEMGQLNYVFHSHQYFTHRQSFAISQYISVLRLVTNATHNLTSQSKKQVNDIRPVWPTQSYKYKLFRLTKQFISPTLSVLIEIYHHHHHHHHALSTKHQNTR